MKNLFWSERNMSCVMAFVYAAIITLIAVCLLSCTSTRKIKTSTQIKIDSTKTVVTTSIQETKSDSSSSTLSINKADQSEDELYSIEQKQGYIITSIDSGAVIFPNPTAEDFAPIIIKTGKAQDLLILPNRTTKQNGKIHKEEQKQSTTEQKVSVNKSDSLAQSSKIDTKTSIAVKTKGKEVKKSGANVWIWVILGIVIITFAVVAWRLGWFVKRRRRDEDDPGRVPLKYKYKPNYPPIE